MRDTQIFRLRIFVFIRDTYNGLFSEFWNYNNGEGVIEMFKVELGNTANETIIFLHGGGLDHTQWKEVIPRLSERFHCVAVDLPMHGRSVHIPLTMEGVVNQLRELFAQYGQVHVVGLSLGGAVTLTALNRLSQYIKSAVISGTTVALRREDVKLLNTYVAPVYRVIKPEWMAMIMMKGFNIPPRFKKEINRASQLISVEQVRSMFNVLVEVELPILNQSPLLVVAGEKENNLVKRAQAEITAYVDNSEAAIAPKVGHVWSYENPVLFAEVIEQWCTNQTVHYVLKRGEN